MLDSALAYSSSAAVSVIGCLEPGTRPAVDFLALEEAYLRDGRVVAVLPHRVGKAELGLDGDA